MTRALRSVSSEKGRDPRDFAIVAYGGSGPVHAAGLADELGVRTVVVPAVAGLFSAVGLLFARPEFHDVRTCHLDVDTVEPAHVAGLVAEMRRDLEAAFPGEPGGVGRDARSSATAGRAGRSRSRCPRQLVTTGTGELDLAALRARFEDEHERLYGVRGQPGSPVEIRAVRLAALGAAPDGALSIAAERAGSDRVGLRHGAIRVRRRGAASTRRSARARRSASTPSPGRCSSTSTTRRSSSRPAGRCAATRRPRA